MTKSSGIDSDFDLVLDPGQTTLRAYVTRAPDGTWVAWAPYFFRILRRQARAIRSHLDLADDVVSTLYDPRDARNTAAVYSLANVTDLGLLQLYGGRAVHPDRDTALALAEAGSARLVTALKGRFRKSVISALTVTEATAYYHHLLDCRHVAALLGQPVRRMTSGAVGTNGPDLSGVTRRTPRTSSGLRPPRRAQKTFRSSGFHRCRTSFRLTTPENSRDESLEPGCLQNPPHSG